MKTSLEIMKDLNLLGAIEDDMKNKDGPTLFAQDYAVIRNLRDRLLDKLDTVNPHGKVWMRLSVETDILTYMLSHFKIKELIRPNLEKIRTDMEWKKMDEEKPKIEGLYLVKSSDNTLGLGFWDSGWDFVSTDCSWTNVDSEGYQTSFKIICWAYLSIPSPEYRSKMSQPRNCS